MIYLGKNSNHRNSIALNKRLPKIKSPKKKKSKKRGRTKTKTRSKRTKKRTTTTTTNNNYTFNNNLANYNSSKIQMTIQRRNDLNRFPRSILK